MTPEFHRGLPSSVEAERSVLGLLLLNPLFFSETMAVLSAEDFTLEKHRRIYQRMCEIYKRGDEVTRLAVCEELIRWNELESVDGASYIADLDRDMPELAGIESYLKKVREKSIYRKLVYLGQKLISGALMAEKEHTVLIEESRSELSSIYESASVRESAETAYGIVAELGGVNEFFKPSHGIRSPWQTIDLCTGGWQDGDLSIIAARPSMGKTTFALNALWHAAANEGKKVIFYSLEMHRQAIIIRLISFLTGIPFLAIKQAHTTTVEKRACREALDQIESSGFRVVQLPARSLIALRAHAERARNRGQLEIAGADYLGLMKCQADSRQSRTQELGEVARGCKAIAMDLGIPFLLLAQLNRLVESRPDKRPSMADIRDSGEIEECADLVAFLHRPGYYKREDVSLEKLAEVIISKQRNGDTPIIELEFNRTCGRFYESEVK